MFTSFDYEVKALNKTKVQLINEYASHLFANIHYSGAKKLIDIQKKDNECQNWQFNIFVCND